MDLHGYRGYITHMSVLEIVNDNLVEYRAERKVRKSSFREKQKELAEIRERVSSPARF